MFIDSALFAWLAYRYKSIPHGEQEAIEPHENQAFVEDDPVEKTQL